MTGFHHFHMNTKLLCSFDPNKVADGEKWMLLNLAGYDEFAEVNAQIDNRE